MIICKMCGAENPDDATECASCGESFTEQTDGLDQTWKLKSLTKVRSGLTLAYYGLVGAILFMLLSAVGIGMASTAIVSAVQGGMLLCMATMVVGRFFCLTAPNESMARPMIIAAVVCEVLSYAGSIAIALFALSFTFEGAALASVLTFMVPLLGVIGHVLFILFCQRIANFIVAPAVAKQAKGVLVMMAIVFGLAVATPFSRGLLGPTGTLLAALAVLFFGLFWLTRYGNLLNALRKALTLPAATTA